MTEKERKGETDRQTDRHVHTHTEQETTLTEGLPRCDGSEGSGRLAGSGLVLGDDAVLVLLPLVHARVAEVRVEYQRAADGHEPAAVAL